MEKLLSSSKLVHEFLYLIWKIVKYYETYLGCTVPEKASDLEYWVSDENGITKLYFKVPKIANFKMPFSATRIVDIFNQHLYYDLLPSSGFPKYKADDSIRGTIESFIVNKVSIEKNFIVIVVVYVDNPMAYEFVLSQPYI